MRRLLLASLTASMAVAGLSAAEFWDTTPFLQWSDKETEKVLSDSPWAVTMAVALPPPPPRESGMNAGGRGGGGDDINLNAAVPRARLNISWRSALPVKQAVVRTQVGLGGTPTPEQQQFLTREDPSYVLAIRNMPFQYARGDIEAFLRPKGKAPIPAAEAATQKTATGPVLLIAFPRTSPIVLEDGEVEFTFKADRFEFKRKFTLKNLTFAGTLAL